MDKICAYSELVADVKSYVMQSTGGTAPFEGYENCDAVNPWTYWQGRSVKRDGSVFHHLNAKILLVGRDWGSPAKNPACVNSICSLNKGESSEYITDSIFIRQKQAMENETDEMIRRLFDQALQYDLTRSARIDAKNEDLFFTNLYPCFRADGKNQGKLVRKNPALEREYLRRLVFIIQPKVILCLGSDVYWGVREALGQRIPQSALKPYHSFVANGSVCHVNVDGVDTAIFALAHPGPQGTLNRIKGHPTITKAAGFAAQLGDWQKIRNYLT